MIGEEGVAPFNFGKPTLTDHPQAILQLGECFAMIPQANLCISWGSQAMDDITMAAELASSLYPFLVGQPDLGQVNRNRTYLIRL